MANKIRGFVALTGGTLGCLDTLTSASVANGEGAFVKKTARDVGSILGPEIDHGALTGLGDDDHPQYVKHGLAQEENDFLIASEEGAFVRKPLAEVHSILGLPHRNAIINGNFDIWRRGTSRTSNGYGSADRWSCAHSGTTKTASRQEFTLGQTSVPGEPAYFMRHVVTSVAGSGNYCQIRQMIEDVRTFAGQTATLSFWAKADASKNIAIEFIQSFGTGGSPSARITGIGAQKIALTTSWAKYNITVDIPSITGKTLGSDGNHCLCLYFWFDAGSDYASRTANLGQQSGTFDIAQVQLEEGSVATPFERRSYGEELALCQRYYGVTVAMTRGYANAASTVLESQIRWHQVMRTAPSVTLTAGTRLNVAYLALPTPTMYGVRHYLESTAAGDTYAINDTITADAEL